MASFGKGKGGKVGAGGGAGGAGGGNPLKVELTLEQKEDMKKAFDLFDTDGSGACVSFRLLTHVWGFELFLLLLATRHGPRVRKAMCKYVVGVPQLRLSE